MRTTVTAICLVLISFIGTPAFPQEQRQMGDLKVQPVILDNQYKPATIPKDWRFVGVANGPRVNTNYLWFQDKEGNIYVIQGYFSSGDRGGRIGYMVNDNIYLLSTVTP